MLINNVIDDVNVGRPCVQAVDLDEGRTWTVVGSDYRQVAPVEEWLEYLRRAQGASPHTVRSYATAMAQWWQLLDAVAVEWNAADLVTLGAFKAFLRTGRSVGVLKLQGEERAVRKDSTVEQRTHAVVSFYAYQRDVHGVPVHERLVRPARSGRPRYRRSLHHLGSRSAVSHRSVGRPAPREVPRRKILTPAQAAAILDACAQWDDQRLRWVGRLRERLFFETLAETGMRLGEALGLRHIDWIPGRGDQPAVEVAPRDDLPWARSKGMRRRRHLFVSDRLERLYGHYLWSLHDLGIDSSIANLDMWPVFVCLRQPHRFQPWKPSSVNDAVRRIKRQLGDAVPADWTPHWFRHTHATALLLGGTSPVAVMWRLGHADIQTTINHYGWVTSDAELKALGDWRRFCDGWAIEEPGA